MTTQIALKQNTLPALSGVTTSLENLDKYIQFAYATPMLTEQEEYDLATDLQKNNNIKAAQRLVLSHLRFVIKIAKNLAGYGLSQADLIQEGTVGLMKAVKRFDPNQGVRLVSFAVHWVKAEMHEFIIKNWKIVKIATTKAQRKLFFKLRSSKKRLGWFSKDEVNQVAQQLDVSPEEVVRMEQRMSSIDTSNSSYDNFNPLDALPDNSANPEQITIEHKEQDSHINALKESISTLDPRTKEIICKRWLSEKKSTLTELSKQYNISPERIRQIEALAMQKLKVKLNRQLS